MGAVGKTGDNKHKNKAGIGLGTGYIPSIAECAMDGEPSELCYFRLL
jgi:hypothetical protein